MNWWQAMFVGCVTALVCFGGLWLTIRATLRLPCSPLLMTGSALVRLAIAGAAFYTLSQAGGWQVLVGLAGFWLVRLGVLIWLGGVARAA